MLTPETKQAVELAARKAAQGAVRQTLLALGIDSSTPLGVQEQQQDMAFLRGFRRAAQGKSAKYWAAIVAFGISIASAAATVAMQHFLGVRL